MTDIINFGQDLEILDTQVPKAANVLGTQLGALEYDQDMGIDLAYFLSSDFKFQDESFKAYTVEVLANNGINVTEVAKSFENLYEVFDYKLKASETGTELVSR